MAEAILTAVLKRMASHEVLHRAEIDAQLNQLRTKLLMIQAVLTDAENKQTSNRDVKVWLNDLLDLFYDLDDLLEELFIEGFQRKLRDTEDGISNIRKLIPSCCTKCSFSDRMLSRGIASKLKEISGLFEDLVKQIPVLSLVENVCMHPITGERSKQSFAVEESETYGREADKQKILEMLFGVESSDDTPISVIPIVGMGGIGKTTLAQLVYNDVSLQNEFDVKAWVCVSDEFDAVRITKTILEQVSSETCDDDDFNILQVKLKQNLSNKIFLVVLDDVWNENYRDWDILRRPFLAGKPGSKILVTTRNETVAIIMSEIRAYHLSLLSDIDALSLLAQQALGANSFDVRPDLRKIGMSVARRCKYLPLALKVVGGMLNTKTSLEEWEEVLESEIWIKEQSSGILPALNLSYQYLPNVLKQCFAYCAIFPRNYYFDKFEIVHLWMAEGFLQQSKQESSMEELGSVYFDELLARSFFQKSGSYTSRFIMHDLISDLAMWVAGDKCLRMDDLNMDDLQCKNFEKVRHFSFISHNFESYYRFSSLSSFGSLRTFLSLSSNTPNYSGFFLTRRVLFILPYLDCLRELSLRGYEIYELPGSIGELKSLRYFNLSRTLLKWLPESVTSLCNLQMLILEDCSRLAKLPARIESLTSLRHLNIANTHQLHEIPKGIARLTSLQTLSKMIVSKSKGLKIKDLWDLSLLQGKISIEELQNVINVEEATDARLSHRPSLNEIRLVWSSKVDDSRNEILEVDVLDELKPHENLSSLEIVFYGGAKFSSWIGDLTFVKLTKMSFKFCNKCTTLPTLGQLPLLKDLNIQGMDQVKVIGTEFYGDMCYGESPFPSLEILTFEDMPEWEEWLGLASEAERAIEIPKLSRFHIRRCPKLVRLPGLSLSSLCELYVENCNQVVLNCMHNLTSLTQLKLVKLYGLTSVLKAFEQFPLKLENFEIDDCEDLLTLWPSDNIGQSLINLQVVVVKRCPMIFSIQEIGVHSVIRSLCVEDCESLKFLPSNISSYRNLMIRNCPSLKMITTLEDCSTSLKDLTIERWVNLSLTNLLGSVHNYSSLTELSISYCDGLESFPDGGLPTPNLRRLLIENCHNLKYLPHWMELLLSLEMLSVINCSCVETNPQGNIPPSLTHLAVMNCEKLNPLGEWALYKLTSLCAFTLEGGYKELVSFSKNDADDQHHLLPSSIKNLTLGNMPNLETISEGFRNLNSLLHLSIFECPKLVKLPMEDELHRLLSLHIRDCHLLKKRCLKIKGDYWPIIADIPDIQIDGCSIYDPDSCP